MLRNIFITILLFPIWILIFGFSVDGELKIPIGKIDKSLKKYFGNDIVNLDIENEVSNLNSNARIFRLETEIDTIGYLYLTRLASCRAGGCSSNPNSLVEDFEYFDYYLVTDKFGKVLIVKVFNYQAAQGHQIMSRGWLRQFIGFNGDKALVYGADIQAISGATISAKTLTQDIQDAEKLILSVILDNNWVVSDLYLLRFL